ncbi:MAG: carbamate kinase [Gemmatimonadota bacterium]|nr:carbamate kinase [Gemmatimonadota bacterium]
MTTASGRQRAVIALGGNALSPSGERSTIFDQFRHTRESLSPIVALAMSGWDVCIVHGNGPQVGDELVRNEEARATVEPLPLGVLVAATAGWIGYMIQQSLENALRIAGSNARVVTVITQVVVDRTDAALAHPSKFVGHSLADERARELLARGVAVAKDGNERWRRVVGSPIPYDIHEASVIEALLDHGVMVVACGGGGIAVYRDSGGSLEGLDCVVDKDLAAAVLARRLEADLFMILTDVDAVYTNWGKPDKRALSRLTVAEVAELDSRHMFGEGSMAPKVRAAASYVRETGGRAIITELSRGSDAVAGRAGTEIVPTQMRQSTEPN